MMGDKIEAGDFLFGYPVVAVSDEQTTIRLPQEITIGFMPRQFRENVLTLLRSLGLWVPQQVRA